MVEDQSSNEIRCECLTGMFEVAHAVHDGSNDHLQCFQYIPPKSVQDFVFVGAGLCMDIDNRAYDMVEHVDIPSVEVCSSTCLQMKFPNLAGIFYVTSEQCFCLFADGLIPFQPNGATWANYAFLGHGIVAGTTNDSDDIFCYSFNGVTYNYVGQGYCVDSSGNDYDSMYYSSIESIEECKHVCLDNSTNFVGIIFGGGCRCLYNDGKVPSQPPTNAHTSYFHGTAKGEITHVNHESSDYTVCYAYEGNEVCVEF